MKDNFLTINWSISRQLSDLGVKLKAAVFRVTWIGSSKKQISDDIYFQNLKSKAR